MSTTISRGVRAPIIRKGDDIVAIAVDSVLAAAKQEGFSINEKDVVCVTESVVARADGNFASVDDIAADVRAKFPSGHVGVVFPIQSRNRFAICLKGIARGAKKVTVQFSYPSDEVGNHLIDLDTLDASGVDPWRDVLSIDEFHKHFGKPCHPFTGMDYVQYYTDIIEGEGAEAEMIFANSAAAIVNYTKDVLAADIHTRERTARLIKNAGGGIAKNGGYIAGKADLVEKCAYRATVPGLGREVGASLGQNRELFMGIFNSPHIVGEALKTAVFAAALFEEFGFDVTPTSDEERFDIIQTVQLRTPEALIAFCQGMQAGAPVDSFVVPEPWDMPGYDSQVIMAAGAFTMGSSIELSADAPLREPYAAWMQGGFNFHSAKAGVMLAAQAMHDRGLI